MRTAVLLLACSIATAQEQDFAGAGEFHLSMLGAKPGPKVERGELILLHGNWARGELNNAISFDRTAKGPHLVVDASFRFSLSKGAHGGGFALLNTKHYGVKGPAPKVDAWEAPNLKGTFAVGLDTFNPPTSHWFNEFGNIHDRPEREISLHWDGKELLKLLSPIEFRDGKPHTLALQLRYVVGGVHATLKLDGSVLVRERFFAGPTPYEARPAFGGRTGGTATVMKLDDVRVRYAQKGTFDAPKRVRTFDGVVLHGKNRKTKAAFDLPDALSRRIICNLTLEPGPGGWDKWDKSAAIYVFKDGQRYEIVRYITPYKRTWTWKVDVTDYQSLLRGKTTLGLYADSWQKQEEPLKGFKVTVDFDIFPGKPTREAYQVINLWNKTYEFGNEPDKIAEAFPMITHTIDAAARGGKLRFMVTGHGNFGEFTAADRTVVFGGKEFRNRLWKEDCYLNPVRPQSGTWKFDRAGWAPGDVVTPWDIQVSNLLKPGAEARILYRPAPFRGMRGKASHWIESQLILYR